MATNGIVQWSGTLGLLLGGCASIPAAHQPAAMIESSSLGAFSVSLAVADLQASKAFYEKLGFAEVGGNAAQNWLIMRNGQTTIGLFHGMFEKNILTFNPGWSSEAQRLARFEDIRSIQHRLQSSGLSLISEADTQSTGPTSLMLADPDGNLILLDQHVAAP